MLTQIGFMPGRPRHSPQEGLSFPELGPFGAVAAGAKAAFAGAWERFYADLTQDDIARWHQFQDAAAGRHQGGLTHLS
jgi:hypothetical protein